MDKPTKPTDLMPRLFGGVKNNFSQNLQILGYEDNIPAIYGGDNLNYQLDATGKELDYCEKIVDFINALPIGKTITTDANNKLVYKDLPTDVAVDEETIILNEDNELSVNSEQVQLKSEKGKELGYCPLDENAKVPEQYLPQKTTVIPFCVVSGNIDSSGNLDLVDAQTAIDTSLEYKEPETYTFTLDSDGDYQIALVGAGSSGGRGAVPAVGMAGYISGGSGAAFVGTVTLSAGNYTVSVGKGGAFANDSSGKDGGDTVLYFNGTPLITAGGGKHGNYISISGGKGGTLTINDSVNVVSYSVRTNGNNGSGAWNSGRPQTASVYNGYGYGGNSGNVANGTGGNGYFNIHLSSQSSSEVNYKVNFSSPLVISDKNSELQTFKGLNKDVISTLENGTYYKMVGNSTSELINCRIFYQFSQPTSPLINDIWIKFNSSFEVKKYDGSQWQDYDKLPVASLTINQGQLTNFQNVTIFDNKLFLTSTNTKAWVIETFSSGSSWYRIYSDGWCEQGGIDTSLSSNTGNGVLSSTIVLLKPFINTNYNITLGTSQPTNAGTGNNVVVYSTKSKNSFQVSHNNLASVTTHWRACGFVA